MAQALHKARRAIVPSDDAVLSKAVARAADLWKLTNESLGDIIGVSASTASRLRAGAWKLEPKTKPFELAQFFVRLFRSLDSLMGSDDDAAVSWLDGSNSDLGGRPIELIRSIKGLTEVANYVDDFRARV
jgi:antitoxin Xre/MbcA/ParS-like protein